MDFLHDTLVYITTTVKGAESHPEGKTAPLSKRLDKLLHMKQALRAVAIVINDNVNLCIDAKDVHHIDTIVSLIKGINLYM